MRPCTCEHCGHRFDAERAGGHRLLCGDSTSAADVAHALGGGQPRLMFADPPFQRDYASRGRKGAVSKAGTWTAICEAVRSLADAAPTWYVKASWREALDLVPRLRPDDLIVWAKRGFGLGGGDFRPQHEMLLYGNRGGVCHAGADVGNVWTFAVPFRGRMQHVAETPVGLIVQALRFSSDRGDLVFDPFAGSGTTIVAAEQTGRRCHAIEIEPRHVDVAVKRWEAFTGRRAVRWDK